MDITNGGLPSVGPPDFNIGGDGLYLTVVFLLGGDDGYVWPPGINGGLGAITNEGDIPIIEGYGEV